MTSLGDIGAGNSLGRYELLVPIAQGGMAVVWAARMKGTRGFQKLVAIKSMLPQLSDDPQFESMFLAEAELAARIRHPNCCEILDLGEEAGTLYIVMEWVDGEPLSAIQKAARKAGVGVPLSIAARIGMHAANGLHGAHELKGDEGDLIGLVHRDVSPQNILVTYDGVVKIVDFGVAKATSAAEDTHTRAGQVKGKVPFMSPEQALGKVVDRRTDIFALGIVLYQLIAGKHPFRGDNDMATLHAICAKAPVAPLVSILPHCPPSLNDAIAQALEKDADKRFQTMAELARALERAVAEMTAAGDTEDLATFVRSVVGDRAEKRKASIRDAQRLADSREGAPESRTSVSRTSASLVDPATRASLPPPPAMPPPRKVPLPPPPPASLSLAGAAALAAPAGPRLPPPPIPSAPPSKPNVLPPPPVPGESLPAPSLETPSVRTSSVGALSTGGTPALGTELSLGAGVAASSPPAGPPAKKGMTIAIAATLAIGIGIGVLVFTRTSDPPPAAAAQPVAAPPPEPTPAPVESAAAAPVETAAPAPAESAAGIDIDTLPENEPDPAKTAAGPARTPTATKPKATPTSTTAKPHGPMPKVTNPGF